MKEEQIALIPVIHIKKFNEVSNGLCIVKLLTLIPDTFNVQFVEYDPKVDNEQLDENGVAF